jgi:hypothetical protein
MISEFCLDAVIFVVIEELFESYIAVLSNLLFFGVRHLYKSLRSFIVPSILCVINIVQSFVLSVCVCSGVVL